MQEVDEIKKKVIQKIRRGLKSKGLTQKRFSEIVGCNERHISDILNRHKPCTLDLYLKYYFAIKKYTN